MALDVKALPVLRKNLDAFIRADPVMVTLIRTQRVETDAGGWVEGPPLELAPQQFRLVPFKRRLYDFTNNTVSGITQVEDYVLVGRVAVDILRDDEFDLGPDHYKVISVEPKTDDRAHSDRVVAQVRVEVGDKTPPVVP